MHQRLANATNWWDGTQTPWTHAAHCGLIALMSVDNLKALGDNIRRLRQSLELSQEEFAHRANIDRSYVGQIERGERNISFSNLCKIAEALGVSVSNLVEGV